MANMPQISTTSLLKVFLRLGFIERDRRNSHIKIVHMHDSNRYASLPNHKGACVAPGTLRNILKSTKVDANELKAML